MTEEERDVADTADHRPDVYYEGDTRIYRASSFGNCEQNLVRQAMGQTSADAPEWMQGKYRESAAHEKTVLTALAEQHGWRAMRPAELPQYEVDESGQFALEMKVPGGVVRCHPDAIAKCYRVDGVEAGKKLPWKLGDRRVVEVKALSVKSSPFDLTKYAYYVWQFSIEMAVTGLPGIFVVAWKDENGELVLNPDGTIRLDIGWYSTPPKTTLDIRKRAARLSKLIRDAEEGHGIPACDVKQFPCGFWAEHDGGVWGKPELEELPADLADLVANITVAKDAADTAKKTYDELRQLLLVEMTAYDKAPGTYQSGKYKVTRVQKNGRRSYDYSAMKAAGYPVEDYQTIGRPSDYVTVEELES